MSKPPIDDFDDDLTVGATATPPIDDFDDDLTIGATSPINDTRPQSEPNPSTVKQPVNLRKSPPAQAGTWRPPTRVSSTKPLVDEASNNRARWSWLVAFLAVLAAATLAYFLVVKSDDSESARTQSGTSHVSW